ncbi:MAG: DNA polymerase III subunit delta [Alphaproteobacteria bacterium]|nr:DNA polymerase III subunit delta [Alphaproteobacteria bacterium]
MKPSSSQIALFLNKPDPQVRAVLLYGPDAGLVRERADDLARKTVPDLHDPFRVANLPGSAVTGDPARLCDEAAAQALGGGRRLVRIQHAPDGVASALGAMLDDLPPGDSLILIEAGDLEKRSKLRALCEGGSPHVIAIPCYVEDAAARVRTLGTILEAEGLKAPRDVLALLESVVPGDRLAMRSEMEKIALYARGKKALTADDVRAALGDGGAAETDDLVHAVANGDAKRAGVLLDHLFAEQVSSVALLRAAQRHFLRLQLARAHIDGGLGAKAAVEKLQPKVFWKHVEPMARQAQRWSAPAIEKFLKRLFETEAAVKKTGVPGTEMCAQLLLGAAK